ncbi:MAG: septum formation inhibitor Maf [Gammaproteobacteria bacterium]|nr:septum formation inhibitor Maf [Gammaproteobacteria bacterium]
MDDPAIVLASASPRRRALLEQIGVAHRIHPVSVDERLRPDEAKEVYVLRVALAKARAGWSAAGVELDRPVLSADTVVAAEGEVLGKPADRAQGLAMLARLSGRAHRVLTAVALVHGGRHATRLSASTVHMRRIAPAERERYWASGEPADKAGAYAVQGKAAVFVTHIEGSYSGIMGLPLFETAELLTAFGVEVL